MIDKMALNLINLSLVVIFMMSNELSNNIMVQGPSTEREREREKERKSKRDKPFVTFWPV